MTEFKIIKNGPLKVTGKFKIKDTFNNQLKSADEVYLCRCGDTNTPPFCDGSHAKNGFHG
ncbi:MAG TPA: CDGSH iron-sulfur domain-containing protein [Bacteroidales bacterium]|nr:CDGSH iron-sulfur domain-containing protein [Bacteroidales bacterium]